MHTLKQRLEDQNRNLLMDKPGIVYAIQNEYLPGLVKIGMSVDSLKKRLHNLNSAYPNEFTVIASAQVRHARVVEQLLHAHFADHRINPAREFFRLTPEDAAEAIRLCGEMMPSGVDPGERILRAFFPVKKRKSSVGL